MVSGIEWLDEEPKNADELGYFMHDGKKWAMMLDGSIKTVSNPVVLNSSGGLTPQSLGNTTSLKEGVWEMCPGYFIEITKIADIFGDEKYDIHIVGPNGRATGWRFVQEDAANFKEVVRESIQAYFNKYKKDDELDWGDLPF